MNFKALILLVVAIALTSAQVQKRVIDTFDTESPTLIILVDSSALPTALESSITDTTILGGERDLQITCEQGADNVVMTAGVSAGIWAVSTPNGASGFSVLQYDGVDGSLVLNPTGLGGVDITSDSAFAFQFVAQTDLDTEYTIALTSLNGGSGSYLLDVAGGNTAVQYIILYTDFDGNIDFTQIGSIEVTVEAHENVDALLYTFTTWGPAGSSASGTPAPPAFSASKSPAPYISWYTFDDDDDGVSPCGDEQPDRRTYFLLDEDIVYYYFYGFSDPPVQFVTVNGASLVAAGLISLIALLVL